MDSLLLDTCAIIWAILDPSRFSDRAATALEAPETVIHILPVSIAEVVWAVERGRIELRRDQGLNAIARHIEMNRHPAFLSNRCPRAAPLADPRVPGAKHYCLL